MGTDPYAWVCWQTLPWQSVNSRYDRNIDLENSGVFNPPPIAAFHSYPDSFGFGVGGGAPPAASAARFPERSTAVPPPLEPMNGPLGAVGAAAERRFLIFDQSGDGTSILFSSIGPPSRWNPSHRSPKPKPPEKCGIGVGDLLPPGNNDVPMNLSGGTTAVSEGGGCSAMREDTGEIDALLYSDSEFEEDADEWEEANSTGRLPTASAEEVGSNSVPTKRRRLAEEEAMIDASLMDTASSARVQKPHIRHEGGGGVGMCNKGSGDDEYSSCVGGAREEQGPPRAGKGLRRASIRETLCVLRKIIPGGKGKDDAAVLDDAIRYLRSLKLKARLK